MELFIYFSDFMENDSGKQNLEADGTPYCNEANNLKNIVKCYFGVLCNKMAFSVFLLA
jgi:hypothetical protein